MYVSVSYPSFPGPLMTSLFVSSTKSSALGSVANQSIQNPAVLYLLSLGTKQSRSRIRRILDSVARKFGYSNLESADWQQIRSSHILWLKAQLEQEEKSPSTINLTLSAIKGVVRQAWSLGLISDHDSRVIETIKGSRGKSLAGEKGRALNLEETKRLIQNCDETPKGIRDALIIALGVGCGLRRTEIAGLKIDNIDSRTGSIKILGKGRKERMIYPSEEVWLLIDKWLKVRGTGGCAMLLCSVRKGGHVHPDEPISGSTIYQMLSKLAICSDVSGFTPHDMRRTFATRMFLAGADINVVRQAMGHSSVATTQRYDKRGQEEVRRFASHLPL